MLKETPRGVSARHLKRRDTGVGVEDGHAGMRVRHESRRPHFNGSAEFIIAIFPCTVYVFSVWYSCMRVCVSAYYLCKLFRVNVDPAIVWLGDTLVFATTCVRGPHTFARSFFRTCVGSIGGGELDRYE